MLTTLLIIENNNVKEDCMHNTAIEEDQTAMCIHKIITIIIKKK